ncbi:MAG: HAMP domain-containing protein [Chloroflexi bacterium]|nr:HAMP domain-containing protein [Chloroflexota bacterium]
MSTEPRPDFYDTGLQPAIFRLDDSQPAHRARRFVSLRWRIVLPLLILALIAGGTLAYVVSQSIANSVRDHELDRLADSSRAVSERMAEIGHLHAVESARLAGVLSQPDYAPLVRDGDGAALQTQLEMLAASEGLDLVLLYGADGTEIIGLQRVAREVDGETTDDYAVSTGTDLAAVLNAGAEMGGPALAPRPVLSATSGDYALLAAGPVWDGETLAGTLLVGTQLERVRAMLRGGDGVDLALYGGPDGQLLGATLPDVELVEPVDADAYARVIAQTTAAQSEKTPVESVEIDSQSCYVALVALVIDDVPLGVVAVYAEDNTLFATARSRDTVTGLAVGLVALLVLAGFGIGSVIATRVNRVARTAHALANGDLGARTGMDSGDEIGQLGAALDHLATRYQRRSEHMEKALRRQRKAAAHLTAVLESVPDGLIVQDLDGRVLLMNDTARDLLGGQRMFRSARLHELTAVVTETLGPALAPGIYALGDPTRLALDDRVLQAQAAAILTRKGERFGTVIVLRDISAPVAREQARDALLDRLSEEAIAPTAPQSYDSLAALAQEVVRNTRSLQRTIAELRDLSTFQPRDLETGQQALPLNDLVWHIAAEWQPLARCAGQRLQVRFGPRGEHILGDDRRLRWAVGNLIDNALKYSPRDTVITLAARVPEGEHDMAEIVVEDAGYGMSADDLAHAFTRFYRGTPQDAEGNIIRQPGTGQGLFIARRVIEAHGGTITVESEPGAGTTATIRLPLTSPVTLEVPGAGEENAASTPDSLPAADKNVDVEWSEDSECHTVRLEPRD